MNEIEKKAITLETAKLTTDENAVLIVSKLISDCRNKISVSLERHLGFGQREEVSEIILNTLQRLSTEVSTVEKSRCANW